MWLCWNGGTCFLLETSLYTHTLHDCLISSDCRKISHVLHVPPSGCEALKWVEYVSVVADVPGGV